MDVVLSVLFQKYMHGLAQKLERSNMGLVMFCHTLVMFDSAEQLVGIVMFTCCGTCVVLYHVFQQGCIWSSEVKFNVTFGCMTLAQGLDPLTHGLAKLVQLLVMLLNEMD